MDTGGSVCSCEGIAPSLATRHALAILFDASKRASTVAFFNGRATLATARTFVLSVYVRCDREFRFTRTRGNAKQPWIVRLACVRLRSGVQRPRESSRRRHAWTCCSRRSCGVWVHKRPTASILPEPMPSLHHSVVPRTGVEPALPIKGTSPSSWRVCQFRHLGRYRARQSTGATVRRKGQWHGRRTAIISGSPSRVRAPRSADSCCPEPSGCRRTETSVPGSSPARGSRGRFRSS